MVRGVDVQNQVMRSLRADLPRLREVMAGAVSEGFDSQGKLADRVCEAFAFRDGRGRWQRASCHQALAVLQRGGHIALPAPRRPGVGGHGPRLLDQPVAPAQAVPNVVGDMRALALVRVDSDAQRRIWNTLMAHEHPLGAGPFVGPQLRYLVDSAHGWLGAVGFAAAARRLRVRDACIGWDDAQRAAHLHRVLGLCRFLIRPGVACRNLASWVLGQTARTVGEDFQHRYGYRPWWLETFVDERQYRGASWRAANWTRLGESAGRGRNDRTHTAAQTPKAVYLYTLEPAFRERLQLPAPGPAPLAAGAGLDAEAWAAHEFGDAPLGDARLSARLVKSAHHMALYPNRAITGATHGARALIKGHYRLIDQPATSAVTVEHILAPHRTRTVQRLQSESTVLCIQDTTSLNFTRHGQTDGLGHLGSNQTGAATRGLNLHATLAINPEGVPLGVLNAAFDAPPPPNPEAKKGRKPLEERKSFRWIEGLRDCAQAAAPLTEVRAVCVMDREADFLDLFAEQHDRTPTVDLLVRAKTNRVLGHDTDAAGEKVVRRLFDELRQAPVRGHCRVEVSRLSARIKASKQAQRAKRNARIAEMTLRYRPVELPRSKAAPLTLWAVHAREEHPPAKTQRLEWFLLTTIPVTETEDATRLLTWYALRWRIEDFFRILKSGCQVEELQHQSAERLERAIAINLVIAWRIQLMVRLGREVPELPAELLFSDLELRVLASFARSRKLPIPEHLGTAVQLAARLGGWTGRTRDPPGAQLLWQGLTQLVTMTFAVELHEEYG